MTIIGLGNIGSHAAMTLCRLGIKSFILYDDDKVERHNLSSQFYGVSDLGKMKVEALSLKMKEINPSVTVIENPIKYKNDDLYGIVIIAVDTMKERKRIFNVIKKQKMSLDLLIDGRIGGPQLEIYTVQKIDDWAKTFTDHPSHDPCGGRFICYTPVIIGALITNYVKKFLKGEKLDSSVIVHLDTLEILKNLSL